MKYSLSQITKGVTSKAKKIASTHTKLIGKAKNFATKRGGKILKRVSESRAAKKVVSVAKKAAKTKVGKRVVGLAKKGGILKLAKKVAPNKSAQLVASAHIAKKVYDKKKAKSAEAAEAPAEAKQA